MKDITPLRQLRIKAGITSLELSKLSGLSPPTISRLETENNYNRQGKNLKKVYKALEKAFRESGETLSSEYFYETVLGYNNNASR